MRAALGALAFVAFLSPVSVHAAVVINEIAWMGTSASANDEWIELYNNGTESVDVTGWTLSDGVSLEIALSGTIAANAYAVLERTDDTSAPGAAFLIYTGALANDGRTLVLKRANGSIEDQVAGGENWASVGGNNTTKDTAQRTDAGWITAAATPGAYNNQVDIPPEDQNDDEGTKPTKDDDDDEEVVKISLEVPNTMLQLRVPAPKNGYVLQPIIFEAVPSGIGKTLLNSVTYMWNFGDGTTALGKKVEHTFTHPGTYVVVARGEYARHAAVVRHEITILPYTFELGRAPNGDVYIHNNARYEVDASGFTLTGTKSFTLPPYTILLPSASIAVPRAQVEGNTLGTMRLTDQKGELAAIHDPFALPEEEREEVVLSAPLTAPLSKNDDTDEYEELSLEPFPSQEAVLPPGSRLAEVPAVPMVLRPEAQQGSVIEANTPIPKEKLPYLALVGVLALGILGVFTKKVS